MIYTVPTAGALPYAITAGPDGELLCGSLLEQNGSNIGRITTGGVVTRVLDAHTHRACPVGIVTGPGRCTLVYGVRCQQNWARTSRLHCILARTISGTSLFGDVGVPYSAGLVAQRRRSSLLKLDHHKWLASCWLNARSCNWIDQRRTHDSVKRSSVQRHDARQCRNTIRNRGVLFCDWFSDPNFRTEFTPCGYRWRIVSSSEPRPQFLLFFGRHRPSHVVRHGIAQRALLRPDVPEPERNPGSGKPGNLQSGFHREGHRQRHGFHDPSIDDRSIGKSALADYDAICSSANRSGLQI